MPVPHDPFGLNPPLPSDLSFGAHVGHGAFGLVPGALPVYPTDTAAQGLLIRQLLGIVPDEDRAFSQDRNAAVAARGGMPGTNADPNSFYGHRQARDYGLMRMQREREGQAAYPAFTDAQRQRDEWNRIYGSAPDPESAANYSRQLADEYFRRLAQSRGGGSPAGGSGTGTNSSFFDSIKALLARQGNPAGGTITGTAGSTTPGSFAPYIEPLAGEYALPGDTGGGPFDFGGSQYWGAEAPGFPGSVGTEPFGYSDPFAGSEDWMSGDVFGGTPYYDEFGFGP